MEDKEKGRDEAGSLDSAKLGLLAFEGIWRVSLEMLNQFQFQIYIGNYFNVLIQIPIPNSKNKFIFTNLEIFKILYILISFFLF